MNDQSITPLTDAALSADSESGSTRELVALCRKLETMCSHAGILRAQEQHNAMMAEKDAEIERLRADAELLAWVLAHPDEAADGLRDAATGDGTSRGNLEFQRDALAGRIGLA